jgi:hypothetical protein
MALFLFKYLDRISPVASAIRMYDDHEQNRVSFEQFKLSLS